MDIGAIIIIIIISALLVLTFYIIGLYNRLIDAKNRVEDKFTQIDLEIKKKLDLIPSLIEIVNKFVKHEEKTINELITVINKIEKSKKINDKITSANSMERTLNKVFTLANTYSDLKRNKNFLSLQKKLEESDDKINYARTFYNDVVLDYNNLIEKFPSNLIAKIFKFNQIDYYK